MEKIPKDPYLEFHLDTLQAVRKELNLHQPGAIEEAIRNFEEWIEKQNNINKNVSKHYIEASIIQAKGLLDKAKKNMERLNALKANPKFFSKVDARKDLMSLRKFMYPIVLPKLTEDNYRVIFHKITSEDFDREMSNDCCRFIILICEYMKAHDYSLGIDNVVDVRGLNVFKMGMRFNLMDLREFTKIMTDGYGLRVKSLHYITDSRAIELVVYLIKKLVSKKVGDRIQVHKSLESLYEFIPKDILPEEYGGREKPTVDLFEDMVHLFSSKENVKYFKDICQQGDNTIKNENTQEVTD